MARPRHQVLLIDDDEDAYFVTRSRLHGLPEGPVQLDWVGTYAEGVAAIRRGAHDAYLLDYQLGMRTGLEVLREVGAAARRAPIILLTGHADPEIDQAAIALGAEDYLVKGEIDGRLLHRSIRYAIARKRVEERLVRSQRDFRRLIEQIPVGVAVFRNERLVFANPGFSEALGAPADVLMGTSVADLVHPDDQEKLARLDWVEGTGPAARRWPWEEVRLRTGGTIRTLELASARLEDFEGEPAMLLIGRDVSERKQLLAGLMLADRMLSVATLAAGVAHEVNNPLAYLISNLGFLAQELADPTIVTSADRRNELLETIAEANDGAQRVRDIVHRLRRFAQHESEDIRPVDVGELLGWTAQMTASETRGRARVVVDARPTPPVRANARDLGQVFLNLVVNAARAVPAGRPAEHAITLRAGPDEPGWVVAEVEDNGCGIPAEHLPRVFDPFFTTRPPGQGMGIGLSIVHNTVRALGGRVEVESEPGRTVFRVCLPTAPEWPG